MRSVFTIAALALGAMTATLRAADGEAVGLTPGPVDVTGTLRTGIMAIGGETTGTILVIPGQGRYELDVGANAELKKAVEALKGKQVRVKGTLVVKGGVEVRERRIIQVETLVAAPEEQAPATPG